PLCNLVRACRLLVQSAGPFYFQTRFKPSSIKRRTSSDILIPVRFANFLSAAIWRSERNMEIRFMACIYVEHIFLSRIKRTRTENKFAGLESLLHASRHVNSQQIFERSSTDFAGILSSRIQRKKSRNCERKI